MSSVTKLILGQQLISITIDRLCYQLIENHNDFSNSVLIGIQPNGTALSKRIYKRLLQIDSNNKAKYGELDISFYRDDFRRREMIVPSSTSIDFIIEGKRVVLIDDVLYTGRTIRAGLDALLAFGRPASVELLTLIDRKFSRQLPIVANYIGKSIDSIESEKVKVQLLHPEGEDGVWIKSGEKQS